MYLYILIVWGLMAGCAGALLLTCCQHGCSAAFVDSHSVGDYGWMCRCPALTCRQHGCSAAFVHGSRAGHPVNCAVCNTTVESWACTIVPWKVVEPCSCRVTCWKPVRKRRRRDCLSCIWCWVRTSNKLFGCQVCAAMAASTAAALVMAASWPLSCSVCCLF